MKQIDLEIKALPILVNICYTNDEKDTKSFILRYDKKKDKVYLNKIDWALGVYGIGEF